jgi:proteasome lid subunit RPN8/RPN11
MTDNFQSPNQADLSIRKPRIQVNEKPTPQKIYSKSWADINMTREAFDKAMLSICSRPAESGGLFLGPVGSNDVTDFFFDSGGHVTGASYSPDCVTLNKKMQEEWIPAGLDMKGFVHSHPRRLDTLTYEDLMYIKKLLIANPDMSVFIAPIIIPPEFRMRAMVVFKDNLGSFVEARINFF